ncbi:Adhesion and penetration protein autotransporter precursor, partial [Haemophilus influenzae]
CNSEYSWFSKT